MKEKALSILIKLIGLMAVPLYKRETIDFKNKIIENISYEDDNLYDHKLDIIYPNIKKDKYPFIINIHGGAFAMNSKDKIYRNYGLRLAQNNFAVVNINFRLSNTAKFPAQIEDVLSAIKYIRENADKYNLDMNNLFVLGDSSGSYMAMMTACVFYNEELRKYYGIESSIKIKGIAANCGMFDFDTFIGKDVSFPMKKQIVERLFGDANYNKLEVYKYSSVLKYINCQLPPVYIMDTEKRSFVAEANRLVETLKKNNVKYKLSIFKKEDNLIHAFNIIDKYKESKIVMDEIFEFFNEII